MNDGCENGRSALWGDLEMSGASEEWRSNPLIGLCVARIFYILLLYLPVLPATHEVVMRERMPIYFATREENENVRINIEQQLELQHAPLEQTYRGSGGRRWEDLVQQLVVIDSSFLPQQSIA